MFPLPLLLVIIGTVFTWPRVLLANGGDQRVVEGKYIINVSRVPFTPVAGQKNKMIISFGDIGKDALITQDFLLDVRIQEFNGNTVVFEQNDILVQGGVLELPYTFTNSGLHEIFFTLSLTSAPETKYVAPDFLIDVQPAPTDIEEDSTETSRVSVWMSTSIGFLSGGLLSWFIFKKKITT